MRSSCGSFHELWLGAEMFKVRGKIEGLKTIVEVTWNDGEYHCDNAVMMTILDTAITAPWPISAPGGPEFIGIQRLRDPRGAMLFITSQMDDWDLVEGEVPSLGYVPPGAET